MLAAAVVDIGRMLLPAVLNAGIGSALMMFVITGAMPLLAIATVSAVEGGAKWRSVWPGIEHCGELKELAGRIAG